MTKPTSAKHSTKNWKQRYNAALKTCGSLLIWLDHSMQRHGQSADHRSHVQILNNVAIRFFLIIKGLYGLALQQAIGLVQSLLQLAKLDWEIPDYSTVYLRQKHLGMGPLRSEIHFCNKAVYGPKRILMTRRKKKLSQDKHRSL